MIQFIIPFFVTTKKWMTDSYRLTLWDIFEWLTGPKWRPCYIIFSPSRVSFGLNGTVMVTFLKWPSLTVPLYMQQYKSALLSLSVNACAKVRWNCKHKNEIVLAPELNGIKGYNRLWIRGAEKENWEQRARNWRELVNILYPSLFFHCLAFHYKWYYRDIHISPSNSILALIYASFGKKLLVHWYCCIKYWLFCLTL